MFTLLAAAGDVALPMNAVGWTVTLVGLALTVAWAAYLYR